LRHQQQKRRIRQRRAATLGDEQILSRKQCEKVRPHRRKKRKEQRLLLGDKKQTQRNGQ
jgi:hypothetical protein